MKNKIILFDLILVGMALSILLYMLHIPIQSYITHPNCQNDIYNKALELTKGDNNETNKVWTVANWVAINITWNNKFPCKKIFSDCETLTSGCGACGEKSDLISSMLNSIGIEAVKVSAMPCRDHDWNEAKIDNQWVFFDAATNEVLHFNMTKTDFEKVYNYTVCNLTAYYLNGTSFDVTDEYKPSF
jgi:transglutaminase-like putative cysteine protease